MQPDGVALGVAGDGVEAVLADGKLLLVKRAAAFCHAACFHRAILAGEVDEAATASRLAAIHLAKRSRVGFILIREFFRRGAALQASAVMFLEMIPVVSHTSWRGAWMVTA